MLDDSIEPERVDDVVSAVALVQVAVEDRHFAHAAVGASRQRSNHRGIKSAEPAPLGIAGMVKSGGG